MENLKAAIGSFYANYFVYQGRSSRSQYWWVALYNFVVAAVLEVFMYATGGSFMYYLFYVLLGLFGLANFIPNLMLTMRRLHDVGKGAGWIFIALIPIIGSIWLLVLMLMPSEGPNRFGNGYVK